MSSLLIIFSILFINGFYLVHAIEWIDHSSNVMQFELFHRHSAELLAVPKTQLERVKELVHIDNHRIQTITRRLRKRRKDSEIESKSAALISMHSGAYIGTGQYFVQLRVGTPSQKFLLIADTGSDLTWMNCRYQCRNCGRRNRHRRFFHADRSSSFETISCSTEMCLTLPFSLAQCSTPNIPCQYDYRYKDGSSAQGIFANETVTVGLANGRKMKLHHVVIGCSSAAMGSTLGSSDGVLGLGYTNYSFVTKAMEIFGGKFSYCLVDHLSSKNISSYLTLGHNTNRINASETRYTQLVLNVIDGFYPVNVAGISIDNVMLNIPINIWDVKGEGGVIIDSGTSLTFLAKPAYRKVMDALKFPLMKFTKELQQKPFEFCFSSIGFNESLVPKLVIHFEDSARFEPPVKSYVIDVSDGVKCLGFMPNGWPDVSVIGNIMQQNFLWEFDIVHKRLGFSQSECVTI